MSLLSFPTHLLQEIISRLPLEAVSSCKKVCKQLLNLVSDLELADLYLYKSRSRPHLLYRYSDSLYLFGLDGEEAPIQLRATTLWSGRYDYLVSSCNDLICSSTKRGKVVTVCNPILRETLTLPTLRNCIAISRLAIGFAANKHYKVLCVVYHMKRYFKARSLDPLYDYEARIYDIGGATTTWRSIGRAPFYSHPLGRYVGTFVNGAVHWFDVLREKTLIHAFDFDTEKFRVIPPPEKMDINLLCGVQVGVVKEYLVVSGLNSCRRDQADVWVMKEYGVKESWTKLYSVIDNEFMTSGKRVLRQVKTLPGGEALVMSKIHVTSHEVCFMSYDIKNLSLHILEAFPELQWEYRDACAVVLTPSLVSLRRIANQKNVENLM